VMRQNGGVFHWTGEALRARRGGRPAARAGPVPRAGGWRAARPCRGRPRRDLPTARVRL